MALQLMPDPAHAFSVWHQAVAAQGFVMFSTIGPGSLGLLRSVYAKAGWGPPHGQLVDMHDLGDMLVEAGFADPVMDQETLSLRYVSAERLLEELHGLGGNLAPDRFGACRGRDWHRNLLAALAQQAAPDGQLTLEIEVVYGHAFRAPDKAPALAARTTIDLAAMKLMLGRSGTPR
jgi:malonyl-CoA O-methyltransferase